MLPNLTKFAPKKKHTSIIVFFSTKWHFMLMCRGKWKSGTMEAERSIGGMKYWRNGGRAAKQWKNSETVEQLSTYNTTAKSIIPSFQFSN